MRIIIDDYKNLHNVTFEVPKTNKLILLGANGVGKTNTLEAIYNKQCRFEDCEEEYARTYLLSLDIESANDFYPHATTITKMFPSLKDRVPDNLINFLADFYKKTDRPLLRNYIEDALSSLNYAVINQKFDPSPLAITRLIILNKLCEMCLENHEKYIILIDSPELYAHPILMDQITTCIVELQKLGCLVIISTHSEHVISRLFTSFEEIAKIVKNADNSVSVIKADMAKVKKDILDFYRQDEYLMHSFSKQETIDLGLTKLLESNIEAYLITAFRDHIITTFFSKIIVLGEGASEDVLFDYICNRETPNWIAQYEVGFLTCMGKSTMPLYFIFLNNIGVKVFNLYDYDNEYNKVHAAYMDAFNGYHFAHPAMFSSYYIKPDLEGYLHINEEGRIQSLIKPVTIYNYTYLKEEENKAVNVLMDIIHENVRRLKERSE